MAKLFRINLPEHCYFVTTKTINQIPIFRNGRYIDYLLENIKFYREKFGFKLLGYVVMLNHFHALITPSTKGDISSIMRDIKSYTRKQIFDDLTRWGAGTPATRGLT